jgi:hypothetical protein
MPERFDALVEEFRSSVGHPSCISYTNRALLSLHQPNVEILRTGHLVSRISDYIIYSVEAKNIDAVVKLFGPCMRYPPPLRAITNNSHQRPSSVPLLEARPLAKHQKSRLSRSIYLPMSTLFPATHCMGLKLIRRGSLWS